LEEPGALQLIKNAMTDKMKHKERRNK